MEPKRGRIGHAWDWVGHIHVLAWLFDGAKVVLGPSVAAMTFAVGFKDIPPAYLIMATTVAFAAVMYIANQFAALYERNKAGFAYGLAYEGLVLALDVTNEEHTLQLGLRLRNVSFQPILYVIKRFEVVIENRTIAKPTFTTTGGLIPRTASRTYRYPAFAKKDVSEFLGGHPKGSIKVEVEYGHPDSRPVRRFWMVLDLSLRLDEKHSGTDIIVEESETRI